MNLPNINLEELKRLKEQNFQERLEFIDKYAEWVRNNKNNKWSSEHKKLIE